MSKVTGDHEAAKAPVAEAPPIAKWAEVKMESGFVNELDEIFRQLCNAHNISLDEFYK